MSIHNSWINAGVAVVALTTVLSVAGCGTDPGPTQSQPSRRSLPFPWAKEAAATRGQFYVTAHTNVGGAGVEYEAGGQLYASTSHESAAVSGGTMTASDVDMVYNSSFGYRSIAAPAFGATGKWGLTGDAAANIPAFTDNMYMPSVVSISAPGPGASISKAAGVNLSWNADPNNDSVIVGISYDASVSHFADSTMPTSFQYSWYAAVPDNGAVTIPASALADLPTGAWVQLLVTRGNSKLVGTNDAKFHIYGTVSPAVCTV